MDYEYPGTRVLVNKFGVMDAERLSWLECRLSGLRMVELMRAGVTGQFDAAHLKSINFALLQDVYDWAGQFRDVYLARGAHVFTQPGQIEVAVAEICSGARAFLDGVCSGAVGRETLAGELAQVLVALNNIHPFREGNGRTQRLFISQMALRCGYILSFAGMTETQMRNASIAGYRGDTRLMWLHVLDGLEGYLKK